MKYLLSLFSFALIFGCSSSSVKSVSQAPCLSSNVKVVELKDYSFTASSFFDDRDDLTFTEVDAQNLYQAWAKEAVSKVNAILPEEARLCEVKFKLIFQAHIKDPDKKTTQTVPISIIESYQEPKTNSVRLGMLEMANDEASFSDTVAHEYSHLVFESLSRKAGATPADAEHIPFWPKSVYEGLADLMASLAMDTTVLGSKEKWSSRDINGFSSFEQTQNSKAQIVSKAEKAFKKDGLIPRYAIYQDWVKKLDHFMKTTGGVDPYAEGTWLAGALRKEADSPKKVSKLVGILISRARSGMSFKDAQEFNDNVTSEMNQL